MNLVAQLATDGSISQIVSAAFGLGLFANALLFVPQAVAIWTTKRADGVSILTFAGFNTMQVIGVVHGMLGHDLALTLGMLASLLTCGTVTTLSITYRCSVISD
jgi:MtN3 and saliva related transmembrane protein